MPFVVATEAHAIPERPPLSLASGDVVTVGRRDADWPAFVFVTTAQGSGWVPSRYLSTDAGRAVVETPYNTTELATRSGEILEVIDRDDESGWLWCRSTDGREGWVPSRSVEVAPGPREPLT
jgi:Variant SH3 domain